MGFHVDTTGNVWLGSGTTGTTLANAIAAGPPTFYVTTTGNVVAAAGTIGGITIDATGIEANYTANTSGFRINASGSAEFSEVDIRLDGAAGNSPTDTQNLTIGSSMIYYNNAANDMVLSAPQVAIQDSSGTPGATSPSLIFTDGTYSNPGFYAQEDNANTLAEFYFSNGTHDIFHTRSGFNILYLDATYLSVHDGIGNNGEVLTRTSNGLEWTTTSGSHSDSDHTSFANSSHGHDISEINNHSHSGLASQSSVTSLSNSLTNHVGHGFMSFTIDASSGGTSTISNGDTLGIFAGSRISTVQSGDSVTISSSALGSISQSGSDGFVTSVSGSVVTTSATKSGTIFTDRYAPISSGGDVGYSFRGVDVFYTSLNSVSDETTKTDITDLTYGLDWINTLRPISYRYDTRTVYVCENDLTDYEYYNSDDICEHCENQNSINNLKYEQDLKDFDEGEIETEPTEPTELTTGLVSKEILWGNPKENWGFSAQEIEATLPTDPDLEIVEDDAKPDGSTLKVLDYIQMIAPLVKAVQELSTQISDLTARVEALEG